MAFPEFANTVAMSLLLGGEGRADCAADLERVARIGGITTRQSEANGAMRLGVVRYELHHHPGNARRHLATVVQGCGLVELALLHAEHLEMDFHAHASLLNASWMRQTRRTNGLRCQRVSTPRSTRVPSARIFTALISIDFGLLAALPDR